MKQMEVSPKPCVGSPLVAFELCQGLHLAALLAEAVQGVTSSAE